MAKLKKSRSNTTTTALYNLAKKQQVRNMTGASKAAKDKAAKQAPITEMNRKSAKIKADIKKRTDSTKEKAKKPDTSKRQQAAYIPTNKQVKARSSKQNAAIAIKYKGK
jgi:hypothetical protein